MINSFQDKQNVLNLNLGTFTKLLINQIESLRLLHFFCASSQQTFSRFNEKRNFLFPIHKFLMHATKMHFRIPSQKVFPF